MLPPPLPQSEEIIITKERLRLLAWGYYISGGLGIFFACFFLIYALMFGAMSFVEPSEWSSSQSQGEEYQTLNIDSKNKNQTDRPSEGPPVILFRIFAVGMLGATAMGWLLGGLTIYAGYSIQKRRNRLFTNIMAAYNAIWIPYGTLLAVFTFIVVNSNAAIRLYEERQR